MDPTSPTSRLLSFIRVGLLVPWVLLAACSGGGGGGGGGTNVQPYILATVISFPTGAVPPGLMAQPYNTTAAVMIKNQTESGTPITDAEVTVNGTTLVYGAEYQQYQGILSIEPGAAVDIRVIANGVTYTLSQRQFSTYPTITDPSGDTTWLQQEANLVSWSGETPDDTATFALGLFDSSGNVVWPADQTLQTVPTSEHSYTISAGSLPLGTFLILVGIADAYPIPGSAPGSGAVIGGFNYAPITITETALTIESLTTEPASATLGVGKSTQLAARATFSDGSSQDVTANTNWSTSDASRVTVGGTGVITGVAFGTATVQAEYSGYVAETTVTVFEPNPSPTPPLTESVAYQIDYAHSGHATVGASGPTFPPSASWSTTLNAPISYPLIAGGRIYVTTGAPYGTASLYALDETTGGVLWGPLALSSDAWAGAAYDHGTLFVVTSDGLLRTFNAASGTPGWSKQLSGYGGERGFSAPPTAVNGIVYVSGLATVFAVDEATGNMLWTAYVQYGDKSSPAISSDGVFVSYPCQVYKFDPLTGSSLWHYAGPCSGGGGKTPAYANKQLFVRDPTGSPPAQIFDAETGAQLGTFSASTIPAFLGETGFFLNDGTLSAINQTTHDTQWTFMGDGGLVSAPIVIDNVVVIGSSHGAVYALDATSGNVIWSGSAGGPISGPDEQNALPLTGLGAGDGYLVVPAGNVLSAWRVVP